MDTMYELLGAKRRLDLKGEDNNIWFVEYFCSFLPKDFMRPVRIGGYGYYEGGRFHTKPVGTIHKDYLDTSRGTYRVPLWWLFDEIKQIESNLNCEPGTVEIDYGE